MRLLFELSGEHPTLPAAEAMAAFALQGPARALAQDATLLLVEAAEADAAQLARRLALTHRIDEALAETALDEAAVLDALRAAAPAVGGVFRVRAHRVGEHGRSLSPAALERKAGALLAPGRRVALEGSAEEVRVLLAARAHIAREVAEVDRRAFDARHVKRRAFFQPVSLHPRFARALVNLARVEPGARVADPFAGTGGVLLEAALVGARVAGADLDARMASGAGETLARYGIEAEVLVRDAAEALRSLAPLDAIVTDPPYGRASSTLREEPRKLYGRALAASAEALRPGGRLAIAFPGAEHADLAPPGLVPEERHVQRVHRSLTRHYVVFRKL